MTARRSPWKDPAIARGLGALARVAREIRLGRGWTLEEAAEHADVDVRHVQLLETGVANPTAATLLRVARGFGVSLDALFGEAPLIATREPRWRPPRADSDEAVGGSDETLAKRVKSLRLARDWSQAELATKAGISQGAVQGIEARSKSPTLRTLDALASAFGVAPYLLLVPASKVRMPKARAGRR